jgi:hypothetical protein
MCDFEHLGPRHRREKTGQDIGQHALACARRSPEEYVVAASGTDFDGTFAKCLADDILEPNLFWGAVYDLGYLRCVCVDNPGLFVTVDYLVELEK